MPARYRKDLREKAGGMLVVTVSIMNECLAVYPLPEWERIESVLQKMPSANPKVHAINHLLVGQATDCEIDGHGRILLPETLRRYAGLVPDPENEDLPVRRVMMVGMARKFELWRKDRWEVRRDGLLGNTGSITSDPLIAASLEF